MEPLEGLDAAFLALEAGNARLHMAAVLVLDPPEGRRSLFSPSTRFAQIRRVVEQRLHLVPQLRQRVVRVPLGLQHPAWVDDPDFDLDDHLHRARLPEPGGTAELEALVADLVARPLDPERPLWEMVVAEGLAGDRIALVAKLHHAMLDGVSGASLLAAFLDPGPRGRPVPFPGERWSPEPLPGPRALLSYATSALARSPEAALGAWQRGVDSMVEVAGHNRRLAAEGTPPPPPPFSAPRTSLNGVLSSRRRYAMLDVPSDDVALVRRTYGTTANDVLLAGVAGALRQLLEARGEVPGRALVAMVPVSTRARGRARAVGDGARGEAPPALGNRLSGMLVSLATDVDDPVARLHAVSAGVRVARTQDRLTGGRLLADLAQLAPPALVSRLARWSAAAPLAGRLPPVCNVVVSNVPGPGAPLWCAGSRVAAVYPVGPVAAGVGLNVTCMSYRGTMRVGVLACRRLVPEVGDLVTMLDDALAELVGAALDARGAAG